MHSKSQLNNPDKKLRSTQTNNQSAELVEDIKGYDALWRMSHDIIVIG